MCVSERGERGIEIERRDRGERRREREGTCVEDEESEG